MPSIPKQRRIIDRATLVGQLDALIAGDGRPQQVRAELLAMLKTAMANGRSEVRRRFDSGEACGEEVAEALSFLSDQVIRLIYDFATDYVYPATNPTEGERLCVAAVGGYGRGELAPFSDIDLLFVLPYKETARQEQVIEYILYLLWDLKLKVGQATRSIDECVRLAGRDLTIRTAMLESRYIWGDRKLFNELRRRFYAEVADDTGPEFVEEKLAERDTRHEKMGGSRYVLEPNIKEGKGGLRDLQTLYWIAKYLYKVDEVANVVDRGVLTKKEALNQIFNITRGKGEKINHLIEILSEYFPDLKVKSIKRDRMKPKRGTLEIEKAKSLLGYDPKFSLDRGYRKYIEWAINSDFRDLQKP